ncbi:hypothetical protein [Rhodococcus wratislaviensis]|uniref:hypothetical protein n=1 Tax=Rhodococcus wratislaviensis TaxID=44752 RepID=UPI003668009E
MGGIVIGMFIIGGIMPIMRMHIIIMSIMFIPIFLTSFLGSGGGVVAATGRL